MPMLGRRHPFMHHFTSSSRARRAHSPPSGAFLKIFFLFGSIRTLPSPRDDDRVLCSHCHGVSAAVAPCRVSFVSPPTRLRSARPAHRSPSFHSRSCAPRNIHYILGWV